MFFLENSSVIWIVIALLFSILIGFYQYYFKVNKTTKIILLLTIFRSLVFFLLFLLLINPSISRTELINQKPKLSVLVDNSLSIKFFKKQSLVNSILKDFKSHKKLNERFNINYYSFGNEFKLSDSLSFDENQTNISKPLESINKIQKQRNNAIVLLSDGNQTLGNDYEYTPIEEPVFTLVIGDTTKYQDVKITQINVNKYSFIDNQFPVESLLQYDGEKPVRLKYYIENRGKIIFSKIIDFSKKNKSHLLQTVIKSTTEGSNFYKAKIQYLENEKNKINNQKNFSVEVINKQSEILIVSSFFHPDLGALKKSIESDKQRKVTIKIINKKIIKIDDFQLVVLYQPNNKFNELIDKVNLKKIPFLLITGSKTEWSFLNKKLLGVKKNNINQVENYSPVYNNNFFNFSQKNIDFENFPPLIDQFGEITILIPNQTLLFQNINGFKSQEPLLATANDKDQKKVFLFGEGLWKWRSTSFLNNNSFQYFDEFINNLVQYASNKKIRNRLDIDIKKIYNANSIIKIGALYVDNNFKFDPRVTILFNIINKKTKKKKTLPFSLSDNSYQLEINYLDSGDYDYVAIVNGQNISKKGTFKVSKFKVEHQFTNANNSKLEKLAKKTNGKLFFEDKHQLLIDELLMDTRFATIQKTNKSKDKLINWQWILFLIIGLLSLEWFIRKYFGKV